MLHCDTILNNRSEIYIYFKMDKAQKYGTDYKSIEDIIKKQGELSNHVKRIQMLIDCSNKEEFIKEATKKIISIKSKLAATEDKHAECLILLEKHRKLADEINDIKEYMRSMIDICHSHNIVEDISELSIKSEVSSVQEQSTDRSLASEQSTDPSLAPEQITDQSLALVTASGSSVDFSPIVDPLTFSYGKPRRGVRLINQFNDIFPLTIEEYNGVPAYMKGRLSIDYIQSFVNDFNQTLQDKYKLYNKSKADIKKRSDLDLLNVYKSQELPGNVKQFFITYEDINRVTSRKMDKQFGNVICILRHVKRIKEDRSKGVHRYVVYN